MDRDIESIQRENRLLYEIITLLVILLVGLTFVAFVAFVAFLLTTLSRRFLKSELQAAMLARASNTIVAQYLNVVALVDVETLVSRLPPVDENAVLRLWSEAVRSTPKLAQGGRERAAYHPVVTHVLNLVTAYTQGRMRLHREPTIVLDGRQPDYCWTPEREAYVTGTSTLVMLEVKTVLHGNDAAPQLHGYMYYALSAKQTLLSWWSWLTGWSISMYGAGCTVVEIRFESLVSTRAGVELRTTKYMPFLPWAINAKTKRTGVVDAGPTPGFRTLVRILLAPPELLGQVRNPRPPAQPMYLEGVNGSPVTVTLGSLLGGGSFGNAFAAQYYPPRGDCIEAVAKIYRDPFRGYVGGHKQLQIELRCLRAVLRDGGGSRHLPILLASSATALLESPCGCPLPVRLAELGAAVAGDPPQHRNVAALRNKREDEALARGVHDGILRALRVLHGIGWLHCDVRLPNCIVVPRASLDLGPGQEYDGISITDSAVLIDFGCAVQVSQIPGRRGVFRMPASGLTFWNDLRGALAIFVETALGGRYSLASGFWHLDVLDADVIALLHPPLRQLVDARLQRIDNGIELARRSMQEAGYFSRGTVEVPGAVEYSAL